MIGEKEYISDKRMSMCENGDYIDFPYNHCNSISSGNISSYIKENEYYCEDSYNTIDDTVTDIRVTDNNRTYIQDNIQECNRIDENSVSETDRIYILYSDSVYEFMGMYIYVLLSNGIYSQVILYSCDDIDIYNWIYISIGCSLSLVFGTYVSLLGNDDGYLNPILVFVMFLFKKVSYIKLKCYTLIYLFASFFASLTIYLINIKKIEDIGYTEKTAIIFSSYKNSEITIITGFFIVLLSTGIFIFLFLCIRSSINITKKKIEIYSIMNGLLYIVISLSLGFSTHFSINPGKDLGSRLLTLLTPWHGSVFLYEDNWFWVPLVAPYLGAIISFIIFKLIIKL